MDSGLPPSRSALRRGPGMTAGRGPKAGWQDRRNAAASAQVCRRFPARTGPAHPSGEIPMKLTRRSFVGGALAAPFLGGPGFGQAKGSVLRVIPHADLKNIDPIWTTAYIS